MFALAELEHRLRLSPDKLDLPLEQAIKTELESIFLDKVIAKLGLCVSIYDIKSIDGGFILPSEGKPTYTVVFRMIMFRPFVGEIISAKLKESSTQGLRLSLGFFDDVYIPSYALLQPSRAEPVDETSENVRWSWRYSDDYFYINDNAEIRFKVSAVSYPTIPLEQEEGAKPFAPMVVAGRIDSEGLGPVEWWI